MSKVKKGNEYTKSYTEAVQEAIQKYNNMYFS